MIKEILRVGEAARFLGVSVTEVKKLRREGFLRGFNIPSGRDENRIFWSSIWECLRTQPLYQSPPDGISENSPETRFLRPEDLRKLLDVSYNTAEEIFDSETITGIRIPGSNYKRFSTTSVEDYLRREGFFQNERFIELKREVLDRCKINYGPLPDMYYI
jgi:hypothetical protein